MQNKDARKQFGENSRPLSSRERIDLEEAEKARAEREHEEWLQKERDIRYGIKREKPLEGNRSTYGGW